MTSLQSQQNHALNDYAILKQTERQRVSDGAILPILNGCESATRLLVLIHNSEISTVSNTLGGCNGSPNGFGRRG
jgi:hypothetical protein